MSDWNEVRGQFDLDWSYLHFAWFFLASHPKAVREAIERHRKGLDRNPAIYVNENGERLELEVKEAAAAYLGVDSKDLALMGNTTMGLSLLYNGLKLKPGQEVLTTVHDHYSSQKSLDLRRARMGSEVRRIELYENLDKVTEGELVERLVKAVRPNTRFVALTWVHSNTGLKLPIRKMADELKRINQSRSEQDRVLFCVDGVHGLGIEDVKLEELGCDFFISGTHKWIFGPRGTGFLWGKSDAWKEIDSIIPTFSGGANWGQLMTPGGFHCFEHQWALREAFDFLLKIGKSEIARKTHGLNRRLKEGLASMKNVRLYTPVENNLSSGITCFGIEDRSADDVVERLIEHKVVATVTPSLERRVRLTPGMLNTEDEIEKFLSILVRLA